MLRYKQHLLHSLEEMTLRELSKEMSIPVPSLHNYINFDVLPRIDNISKMAEYYNESISSLFSEDNDTTAALVEAVRKLPLKKQKALLNELQHGR